MGAAEDVVGMERGDRKGTGDKEVTEGVQEEDDNGPDSQGHRMFARNELKFKEPYRRLCFRGGAR